MATALAAHANATAAGYARIQIDRGSGKSPRFVTRYEKPIVGVPGQSGGLLTAEATSDVSQAAADTAALAALNSQRQFKYSFGGANTGKSHKGDALTDDLN